MCAAFMPAVRLRRCWGVRAGMRRVYGVGHSVTGAGAVVSARKRGGCRQRKRKDGDEWQQAGEGFARHGV